MVDELKTVNNSSPRGPREYGANKGMLALWDLSKNPVDNTDRVAKLGETFDFTRAVAIEKIDPVIHSLSLFDGVHDKPKLMTARAFEPDNFWFHMHDEQGRGVDSVWELRMIADHTNKVTSRKHRGTPVIDQCDHQRQGYLGDLIWGVDIESDAGDQENLVGPAGFTRMLESDFGSFGGETGIHLALALNLAKKAGFVTDGDKIGQFNHAFRLAQKDGEVGSTQEQECQPKKKRTLCLDGGVNFLVDKDLCHLGIGDYEDEEPLCGQPYVVEFFVRDEVKRKTGTPGLSSDPASNHQDISPDVDKSLHGVVRIPEDNNAVPTGAGPGAASGTATMPIPSSESSIFTPQPPKRYSGDATGSARPGAVVFEAEDLEGMEVSIPIRNPVEAKTFIDYHVMVRPTAAYGGGESSNLVLVYRPLARGEDATAVSFSEIAKVIDSSLTLVTPDGWNQVTFRIPTSKLSGKSGGVVQGYLYMTSDSTGPDLVVAPN